MDLLQDKTVAKAYECLAQSEKAVIEAKKLINSLYKLYQQVPPFDDAETDGAGGVHAQARALRKDEYYKKKMGVALVMVLERLRSIGKSPSSLDDIYATLEDGGFDFSTDIEKDRRSGISVALSKGDEFHRLPQGGWGLTAWYPGAKKNKKNGNGEGALEGGITKEKSGGDE